MSSDSPSKPHSSDALRNRLAPYTLWLVISLVVTNLVALYTFAIHPSASSPSYHRYHYQQHYQNLVDHRDDDFFRHDHDPQSLTAKLTETLENLMVTQRELSKVKNELGASLQQLDKVRNSNSNGDTCDCFISTRDHYPQAPEFHRFTSPRELPLGFSPMLKTDIITSPIGHSCLLQKEALDQYMTYTPGEVCPDDEELAQKLLTSGCEPLPRRRCFAVIPSDFSEPYPVPESFWTIPPDGNIVWTAHPCKSFDCLNARKKMKVFADCLDCFDLQGREIERWAGSSGGLDLSIEDVLSIKPGSIRIGLDIGGGTATFAVRMRQHNVTIVTTTLNFGGPFNNFIALRGVIPLYLTVSQRFPFFDNTLDIVHSMHVLSNWIPAETLEFILFDIDRVLRPGGLFWLDHFFAVLEKPMTRR